MPCAQAHFSNQEVATACYGTYGCQLAVSSAALCTEMSVLECLELMCLAGATSPQPNCHFVADTSYDSCGPGGLVLRIHVTIPHHQNSTHFLSPRLLPQVQMLPPKNCYCQKKELQTAASHLASHPVHVEWVRSEDGSEQSFVRHVCCHVDMRQGPCPVHMKTSHAM